jgi:hypothetical protein
MKTLTVAAMLLALVIAPAEAQMGRRGPEEKPKTEKKPVIDEKAYHDALKRIPEPKDKYDPWGMARPGTADPKQAR